MITGLLQCSWEINFIYIWQGLLFSCVRTYFNITAIRDPNHIIIIIIIKLVKKVVVIWSTERCAESPKVLDMSSEAAAYLQVF